MSHLPVAIFGLEAGQQVASMVPSTNSTWGNGTNCKVYTLSLEGGVGVGVAPSTFLSQAIPSGPWRRMRLGEGEQKRGGRKQARGIRREKREKKRV